MADLVPSATHFYVQGHENVSKTQLKAASLALRSFVSADTQHDLLRLDNATAVAYVNHVGGTRSPDLAALALEMWSWAPAGKRPDVVCNSRSRIDKHPSGQVFAGFFWTSLEVSDLVPEVLNMLFVSPVLLPQSWDLLFLPHNRRPHPLLPDLMLAAWPRSGDSCRVGAFSAGASDLILSAWRESTSRQYQSAWAQWASWCDRREIDPVCGSIESVVEYLEWMFRQNYGYTLPGKPARECFWAAFPQDRRLCAFTYLKEYLRRTSSLRKEGGGEQKLFISFSRPHRPVGSATLARWVKSGVDTATFSAHFTRGASTSAATAAGVSLHSIMNAADWSRESTFLKYYRRDNNQHTFDQAVLSTALKSA
ncbi:hypothetical protein Bbelb_097930 [Branchiostoma belcheri]|nr:hypothetical protein Bbelb_097930 [Branchiostoma belcheri]